MMKKKGVAVDDLQLSNGRYCVFYASYINAKNLVGGVKPDRESIRRYLERLPHDNKESLTEGLWTARDKSLLEKREFDWIESSDLIADLVWIVLNDLGTKEINDELGLSTLGFHENEGLAFSRVKGPFPYSSFVRFDDRLDEIMAFFDLWSEDVFYKKKLMRYLKEICADMLAQTLKLTWLDEKYEGQCNWAWDHLKKASLSQEVPIVLYEMEPLDSRQKHRSIIAYLVFWDVEPAAKEYFILKFKKAWGQKVYRDKQVGRSPLNTYISNDVRGMLTQLSKENDEKLYQTLERAIKKAYQDKFGGA